MRFIKKRTPEHLVGKENRQATSDGVEGRLLDTAARWDDTYQVLCQV